MEEFNPNDYEDAAAASDPGADESGAFSDSYAAYGSEGTSSEDGFEIGVTDGQEVDVDGDGIADGTATVVYDDLDGDGVADHATISVVADTDGDGTDETVVLINQYDTDQDGFADTIDATYGVDSDGDGAVDDSTYGSGTIDYTDDANGATTQTVTWDDPTSDGAADSSSSDDQPTDDGDSDGSGDAASGSGPAFEMLDPSYGQDVDSAYVDPVTGEWVETTTSA